MNSVDGVTLVIGPPRSGSTWFGNILRYHPALQVCKDDTAILYLQYPGRTFNPFAEDGVLKASDVTSSRISKLRRHYLKDMQPGKHLVLVSPTNTVFFPLLAMAFPEARLIHLGRNPLDTISSFRRFLLSRSSLSKRYQFTRRWGSSQTILSLSSHLYQAFRWLRFSHAGYLGARPVGFQKAAKKPLLEFLVWYYCTVDDLVEQAMSQTKPERVYRLRYEHLVRNFEVELGSVLGFLEVPVDLAHTEKTRRWVADTRVARFGDTFKPEEIEKLIDLFAGYHRHVDPGEVRNILERSHG